MSSFNPYKNTFNEPHVNCSLPCCQVLDHSRQLQQEALATQPKTSSLNTSASSPWVYGGYDSAQNPGENFGVFDDNICLPFPTNSTEENDPWASSFRGQQTQGIAQNSLQQDQFAAQGVGEGTPNYLSTHFVSSLEEIPAIAAPDTPTPSSTFYSQPPLSMEQEIEAPQAINLCYTCRDRKSVV